MVDSFSQLYFTINLEEIFYFNNKKCRIYAAFGVSQTPNVNLSRKESTWKVKIKAKELFAQAICHEIDHLDGILFIDKILPGTLEYVEPNDIKE